RNGVDEEVALEDGQPGVRECGSESFARQARRAGEIEQRSVQVRVTCEDSLRPGAGSPAEIEEAAVPREVVPVWQHPRRQRAAGFHPLGVGPLRLAVQTNGCEWLAGPDRAVQPRPERIIHAIPEPQERS